MREFIGKLLEGAFDQQSIGRGRHIDGRDRVAVMNFVRSISRNLGAKARTASECDCIGFAVHSLLEMTQTIYYFIAYIEVQGRF